MEYQIIVPVVTIKGHAGDVIRIIASWDDSVFDMLKRWADLGCTFVVHAGVVWGKDGVVKTS